MGGDFGEPELDEMAAASGTLTGLAQDQNSFMVAVDEEARIQAQAATGGAAAGGGGGGGGGPLSSNPRQLGDIVKWSNERWMLATDGADEEYYRELKALGYQNEEVEEMKQQRGREYHGMLRLGCRRYPQTLPELVRSVSHLRVTSIAAGYAHCILLTDAGHMYGAGYNDRGQLGLG